MFLVAIGSIYLELEVVKNGNFCVWIVIKLSSGWGAINLIWKLKNFEKNVHEFVWGRSGYETVDIDENAIKIDEDQIYEFKNIDRMFLYKNFFFFITNEKKIFIFKTTDMESDELIKIIKTTGILFEKKEKPFNIYKYCKKGKSF